jgi:hypothetical protein
MKDLDPLSFLKTVYMDVELPLTTRMRAAMAILPFIHPKLAVTAVVQDNDLAEVLDRRLRRIEEMRNGKLIDATPKLIEAPTKPPPVEVQPPKPHIGFDRRFRRF